jgi:hypothetical protein
MFVAVTVNAVPIVTTGPAPCRTPVPRMADEPKLIGVPFTDSVGVVVEFAGGVTNHVTVSMTCRNSELALFKRD